MKQYVLGNGLSRDLKFQYHIDIDTQIRMRYPLSVRNTYERRLSSSGALGARL